MYKRQCIWFLSVGITTELSSYLCNACAHERWSGYKFIQLKTEMCIRDRCAAPNLREKPSNAFNTGDGKDSIKITDKELLAIHEKRLRRILDVALSNKVETIVLGAFGCGAFMNNPNVVAQASKNVLNEYLYAFKNIEFAVYCLSLIHI